MAVVRIFFLFMIISIFTFAAYNLPIDKCRFLSASVFYV